jgi:hypothetical protein
MNHIVPSFTDEQLFVAQELWALVEQARQAGKWPFGEETI